MGGGRRENLNSSKVKEIDRKVCAQLIIFPQTGSHTFDQIRKVRRVGLSHFRLGSTDTNQAYNIQKKIEEIETNITQVI